MLTILHGEDTTASRARLGVILDEARQKNTTISRLVAKKLSLAELEEAFVSTSLFEGDELVVLEELHSLPKSKKKEALLALFTAKTTNQATQKQVVLWESRQLTATMLKRFPAAKVQEFKLSKKLFQWLDSLGQASPTKKIELLKQSVASQGEYLCFVMLVRQIRLLIMAKAGGKITGAPFMISKLRSQAQRFSLEKLLATHLQLLEIDRQLKRSENSLTLTQQLDLITLSL